MNIDLPAGLACNFQRTINYDQAACLMGRKEIPRILFWWTFDRWKSIETRYPARVTRFRAADANDFRKRWQSAICRGETDAESASIARVYRNGESSKSFRVKERSFKHASILGEVGSIESKEFWNSSSGKGPRRPREQITNSRWPATTMIDNQWLTSFGVNRYDFETPCRCLFSILSITRFVS